MSPIENLFNEPTKALAIIAHLSKNHEIVATTITELHMQLINATSTANQLDNFLQKLNDMQIPKNMFNNLEAAISERQKMENLLDNNEISRADLDLYIMETFSLTDDLCSIGQQFVTLVGKNDQFNLQNIVVNFDTIFVKLYNLFHEVALTTFELVKEYGSLN